MLFRSKEGRVAGEELEHEHPESVPVGSLSVTGCENAERRYVSEGLAIQTGRKRTSRERGTRGSRTELRERERTRQRDGRRPRKWELTIGTFRDVFCESN